MKVFHIVPNVVKRTDQELLNLIQLAYDDWESYMEKYSAHIIKDPTNIWNYKDIKRAAFHRFLAMCIDSGGKSFNEIQEAVQIIIKPIHDYMKYANAVMASWNGYSQSKDRSIGKLTNLLVRESAEDISKAYADNYYPHTPGGNLEDAYYIVHPLKSTALVMLNDFFLNVTQAKEMEMLDIFRQLGATRVEIKIDSQNSTSTTNTGGVTLPSILNAELALKIGALVKKLHSISANMTGVIDPNVKPNMLQYTLWNRQNQMLDMLVKGRQPNNPSRFTNFTITDNFSSNFQVDIELSAAILDKDVVKVKSESAQLEMLEIKYEITF